MAPPPVPRRFATPAGSNAGGGGRMGNSVEQQQQLQAYQYQVQQQQEQLRRQQEHQQRQYPHPNQLLSPQQPPPRQFPTNPPQFPTFAPSPYPPPSMSIRSGPSPGPGPGLAQNLALLNYPASFRPLSVQLQQDQTTPSARLALPPSAAPQANLTLALDRIQTSLTVLHERLSDLERTRLASSSSNSNSPLSLLRQTLLRLLILLRLRTAHTPNEGKGAFGKIVASLWGGARRVMWDVMVVLVVGALVGRVIGGDRGDGGLRLVLRLLGGRREGTGRVGN